MKRGAALMNKKDYNRALLEFRNAAKAMPKDAEPYYQMGLAFLAMSNLPHAAGSFRQATELNPKHMQAQLKYAEMLTASRNRDLIEDASKRLETVLANTPDDPEAANTLAIAEWQLGQQETAAGRLEKVLEKLPDNLRASVGLARMKLTSKDLAGAEAVLQKAVSSAPKSADARLALAQLYVLAKQPDKAETAIREALKLDPENAAALAGLAALQMAGHRTDEAEQTYKRLSSLPAKEFRHVHALFLFQTGRRDQALAEFKQLAESDQSDRNARSRLLAAYVAMGKIPEAKQLLAAALKKNANDTDALFQRAELSLKAGDAQGAETDLKQVLHFRADSPQAHAALAEVYRARGSVQMERQELTEALRLSPSMIGARVALARNFMLGNEPKSAVNILDQAPPAQRRLLGVVVLRNWALFAGGNVKEMRVALDSALNSVRHPELLIQDGVLKMRDGNYVGARVVADEILRQVPDDVRAARLLADSLAAQQQPQKAIERLTELVTMNPKSAQLRFLLAQYYTVAGKRAEARQAFEAAKTVDPGFIEAELALAGLDRQENRPDDARRRLAAVVAAAPRNVPALLSLASLQTEAGNREEAIVKYRAVLQVDPDNALALNNLAWHLAQDNADEALKFAQQAGELNPDDPAIQDTLGWIYYRKGVYRTAVEHLKSSVAKESTPRRQFHLGMAYMRAGDRETGQKVLNAALQKDPNLAKTEQGW